MILQVIGFRVDEQLCLGASGDSVDVNLVGEFQSVPYAAVLLQTA